MLYVEKRSKNLRFPFALSNIIPIFAVLKYMIDVHNSIPVGQTVICPIHEIGLFLCPSVCSRHECRRQIHIRTRRHCVEVCLSYGIRLSFPNIYSNASAGLNQLLLATGLVAVLFSAIANNSCSYMKKSKVTLSVSGERKSYSVEYDSLESLSQSVFDLLGCVSARLDETVVILADGSSYRWNEVMAHNCFAKGRISVAEFVDYQFSKEQAV